MQRREFLKASLAVTSAAGASQIASTAFAQEKNGDGREYYELRSYLLKPDANRQLLDDYFAKAFIPALNRLGVSRVGVFAETPAPQTGPAIYVLIPHPSLAQFATVATRLMDDAAFQKAGEAYLCVPSSSPVFDRIESSLMVAFAGMPKLEAPAKGERIFNLRIYESHSEMAGKKKVEMFNKAGEIAIFRRVGLTPVFFGETIAGLRMPNLTYMLTFPNEDARKAAWDKFRADPDWLKLRAMPEYADKNIVSKITNRILTPAEYSQV